VVVTEEEKITNPWKLESCEYGGGFFLFWSTKESFWTQLDGRMCEIFRWKRDLRSGRLAFANVRFPIRSVLFRSKQTNLLIREILRRTYFLSRRSRRRTFVVALVSASGFFRNEVNIYVYITYLCELYLIEYEIFSRKYLLCARV